MRELWAAAAAEGVYAAGGGSHCQDDIFVILTYSY